MTEPTTKAGRALLRDLVMAHPSGQRRPRQAILAIEAEARSTADAEIRDVALRLRGRLRGVARHEPHCRETSLDERQGMGVCSCGLLKLFADAARALLADKPVGSEHPCHVEHCDALDVAEAEQ